MKKLNFESLSEFLNESNESPLSTFYDVLVTQLQSQFDIDFEKADFVISSISDVQLKELEQDLEYNGKTLEQITEEIYKIGFHK